MSASKRPIRAVEPATSANGLRILAGVIACAVVLAALPWFPARAWDSPRFDASIGDKKDDVKKEDVKKDDVKKDDVGKDEPGKKEEPKKEDEKKDDPKKEAPKRDDSKVDVVFVVDATASMDDHLKNLRNSMDRLAEQLQGAKLDARYAALIFRDRVDDKDNKPEDPFPLKFGEETFTKDVAQVAAELAKIKAEGGGDFPESALDGIAFAARLPFRPEAKKVLIAITDAPPRVPDKEMKDETQLAALLKERGIDQVHVFHDIEPERYKALQAQLGKGSGRAISLFPGGVERMKTALADIARDVIGGPVVAVGPMGTGKLDVVFVVDTTGSMGGDLGSLRDNVKRFTKALLDAKADFQIGVTTFKDRLDDPPDTRDPKAIMFEGKEWTADPDALVREVGNLKADGGGDEPESGFDALAFASARSFRPGARKVLILVTDAPPKIPDKDMKNEDQVHGVLKERGIEQLHLIIRSSGERYTTLNAKVGKGRVVNIGKGEEFGAGLETIAKDSAEGIKEVAGGGAGSKKVDVVVVLDATGSMDAHIAGVRDNVKRLIANLEGRKLDVRVGVTVFRDAVDKVANTPEDPFALSFGGDEFTSDPALLEKELAKIAGKDGGDIPESGFDGLEFASRRGFRPDANRVLVMVTDAPPRIPDKKMKNETETAEALRRAGIQQLHLIVSENPRLYEDIQRLIERPGRTAGIKLSLTDGKGFAKMFDDVSDAIVARLGPVEPIPVIVDKGKGGNKLDVVFVVDTTGSMGGDLTTLRDQIARYHGVLSRSGMDFRIGVVSFKDRVEDPPETRDPKAVLFGGNEFTARLEDLQREIGALRAEGGGDDPESGLDALAFATRRAFRPDARKVLILVTDAPPRIPDKDMKDEEQVARHFKETGISQFHLIGRNAVDRYENLVRLHGAGMTVRIDRDDFGIGLEKIATSSLGGVAVADRVAPIAGQRVDLVFVIDTTGSMSDFAGALQKPAELIINKLRAAKADVRFSMISFRDRHPGDGNVPEDHKLVLLGGKEFSDSLDELRAAIGTLKADSGGDAPESSLDALAFAGQRSFRLDALKVVVLVTDEGPKVPDKDMKDENDVLRVYKARGIHQLHLIVGNDTARYSNLQMLMGKIGVPAGKTAKINDRGGEPFNRDVDSMAVAILDEVRRESRVKLTEKPLPPLALEKTAKGDPMIDVVFVVDATASMETELRWVEEGGPKMLKRFKDLGVDARLGVTVFRDRVDMAGNTPEDPFPLVFKGEEFTSDPEEFKRQMSTVKAKEGGDIPESSLDGMEFASRSLFRKGAFRVLILVTDAPPRIPDKEMKDEFQLGEKLRERGINQLHLLLKTDPDRYVTVQRFLTGDGGPAGVHYDLAPLDRGERTLDRLMDALARSSVAETRRALARMGAK